MHYEIEVLNIVPGHTLEWQPVVDDEDQPKRVASEAVAQLYADMHRAFVQVPTRIIRVADDGTRTVEE